MTELTTPPGSTQNVIFMGTPTSTPNAHNTLPIYAVNSSASGVQGITAGPGISTTGGTGSYPMVSNTGILDVTAGSGISITGSPSNALISNTGITSVVAGGTGLQVTTMGTQATVQNTGVISVTAGTNVSLTGTPSFPVINCTNSGITNITTDATIATTGGSSPQLSVAYPCGLQTLTFQAASSGSVQFLPNGTNVYITDTFIPLFGVGGSRVGTMHNFIIPAFGAAVTTGNQYLSFSSTTSFNGTVVASNSTTTMNSFGNPFSLSVATSLAPFFFLLMAGTSAGTIGPLSLQVITSN